MVESCARYKSENKSESKLNGADMTLEQEIKTQLEKSEQLLKAVAEAVPSMPEYPTYANLGDLKRYNERLAEILETFGRMH